MEISHNLFKVYVARKTAESPKSLLLLLLLLVFNIYIYRFTNSCVCIASFRVIYASYLKTLLNYASVLRLKSTPCYMRTELTFYSLILSENLRKQKVRHRPQGFAF